MGILWAAHKKKNFGHIGTTTQEEFAQSIEEIASHNDLMMIEDHNKGYKDYGPVGAVSVSTDGWKVFPHVEYFPWATKRNILRSTVSFLQMTRYKKIGCVEVRCLEDSKTLFDKCIKYGVLFGGFKIPGGDPRGDELIYSIRGRKKCQDSKN